MPLMVWFTVAHVAVGALAFGAAIVLALVSILAPIGIRDGARRNGCRVMRDYIELTKPRITWLILMSTGIGYFFGLPAAATWREFLPGSTCCSCSTPFSEPA